MKKLNTLALTISIVALLVSFTSCNNSINSSDSSNLQTRLSNTEIKNKTAQDGQKFYYLIRYNKGTKPAKLSEAGWAKGISKSAINEDEEVYSKNIKFPESFKINRGYPALAKRNSKIIQELKNTKIASRDVANVEPVLVTMIPTEDKYNVDVPDQNTKNFKVLNPSTKTYEPRNFTLTAKGEHCLIWYEDGLDEKLEEEGYSITQENISEIQTKFDALYEIETEVFGKAKDYTVKDPINYVTEVEDRVSIVITNFNDESICGFFSTIDLIKDSAIKELSKKTSYIEETDASNENQIIYINYANIIGSFEDSLLTIAHEFQHLLGFIRDSVHLGENFKDWYTEMLSVLAEDIFCDFITENEDFDKPFDRLSCFKNFTNHGVTYWVDAEVSDEQNNISYAVNYAFGAYLFRNYGDIDLLKVMTSHDNSYLNEDAITNALQTCFNSESTFDSVAKTLCNTIINYEIDDPDDNYLSLKKEVNFASKITNYTGDKSKLKAKAIDINSVSGNTVDLQFYHYGKPESKIIYPYGFFISQLHEATEIEYADPIDENIELIFIEM